MIVWVKSEATGRHNDQRAEIERVEKAQSNDKSKDGLLIYVKMLGCGTRLVVKPSDICRVDLPTGDPQLSVSVNVVMSGHYVTRYSSPQTERLVPDESDDFRKYRFCKLAEYFARRRKVDYREIVLLDAIYAVPDNLVPVDSSLRSDAYNLVGYLLAKATGGESSAILDSMPALRTWVDKWWEQNGLSD